MICPTCGNSSNWHNVTVTSSGVTATYGNCGTRVGR